MAGQAWQPAQHGWSHCIHSWEAKDKFLHPAHILHSIQSRTPAHGIALPTLGVCLPFSSNKLTSKINHHVEVGEMDIGGCVQVLDGYSVTKTHFFIKAMHGGIQL